MIVHVCVFFESFLQGSDTFGKVLDFSLNFPGPGKSWKMSLVLESPGIYLFKLINIHIRCWSSCLQTKDKSDNNFEINVQAFMLSC